MTDISQQIAAIRWLCHGRGIEMSATKLQPQHLQCLAELGLDGPTEIYKGLRRALNHLGNESPDNRIVALASALNFGYSYGGYSLELRRKNLQEQYGGIVRTTLLKREREGMMLLVDYLTQQRLKAANAAAVERITLDELIEIVAMIAQAMPIDEPRKEEILRRLGQV